MIDQMYKDLYEESVKSQMKMAALIGTLSAKLFFIEKGIDAEIEVVKAREAIEAWRGRKD
jgi:hypothetical protein